MCSGRAGAFPGTRGIAQVPVRDSVPEVPKVAAVSKVSGFDGFRPVPGFRRLGLWDAKRAFCFLENMNLLGQYVPLFHLLSQGEPGHLFTRLAWPVAKGMRVGCFCRAILNAKRALLFSSECMRAICFVFGMICR